MDEESVLISKKDLLQLVVHAESDILEYGREDYPDVLEFMSRMWKLADRRPPAVFQRYLIDGPEQEE